MCTRGRFFFFWDGLIYKYNNIHFPMYKKEEVRFRWKSKNSRRDIWRRTLTVVHFVCLSLPLHRLNRWRFSTSFIALQPHRILQSNRILCSASVTNAPHFQLVCVCIVNKTKGTPLRAHKSLTRACVWECSVWICIRCIVSVRCALQ